MKKLLLSIIMICALSCSNKIFAQCSPDTSFKTTGTLPARLDTANVGVAYSQVIQFHMTKDTLIYVAQLGQTINATIDTLWITGVKGMPAGFTYTCHNTDCKILGGKTGCATLMGTPTPGQGGIYPLVVMLKIRATGYVGPLPVGQTITDSNSRYTMVVKGTTGFSEFGRNDEPILYPNPASEELQVFVPGLRTEANYSLIDVQGREIQNGLLLKNGEVSHLNLGSSKKGIYFIQIKTENNFWVKKFLIE